jgi:type I restriction enzyme R subunit
LRILLDRPKGWGTEALGELRQKLSATNERFTVTIFRRPHKVRYDKALVDIISMVQHAARDQEPLFTAPGTSEARI